MQSIGRFEVDGRPGGDPEVLQCVLRVALAADALLKVNASVALRKLLLGYDTSGTDKLGSLESHKTSLQQSATCLLYTSSVRAIGHNRSIRCMARAATYVNSRIVDLFLVLLIQSRCYACLAFTRI